jgi:hypothetical protein
VRERVEALPCAALFAAEIRKQHAAG